MSLETGSYIEDLVETNPVGATDFVSQGDDHIRLVKKCIKGSFPSLGQNAVSLTALQINDAALKSVTQTISGAWTFSATLTATLFSGSGASLTSLSASNISSGTLADGRLSSNVPLKNAANTFASGQVISDSTNAYLQISQGSNTSYLQGLSGNLRLVPPSTGSVVFATGAGGMTGTAAGNWTIDAPGSGTPLRIEGQSGNTNMLDLITPSGTQVSVTLTQFGVQSWAIYNPASSTTLCFHDGAADRLTIGTGLQLGAPTGGDKGSGTLNTAGTIYQNNVAVQSLPLVSSTSTTLAKGQIHHISGTATIPTLAAGEWVCVVNTSGSGITINKVASSTAYWTAAGSSISNSVTLGPRGRLVVSGDGSSYFFTGDITGTA